MEGPFEQPTRQFPAERYFPGRKMFSGRFVLERRIGRGGMGEVWLASDNELGRDVALKFAPAEVANDPKSIAELRREVIAGLELSHPRIARVYDLQVADGEAAISMECVKGKSLSDLQAETPHGFFEPEEIAGWIDDVKDALDYAHTEAKRTHRDVKPKNILVDANTGHAKLVDFGISKRLSDSFTRNTGKDSSGSLAYMSPQQMMGERNSAEDDWYSLGATVYELLTGAPPFFRGDVRTQIERVVPPPMNERRRELVGEMIDSEGDAIPQEWEDWVARMLSKERGRMEEDGAPSTPVVAPPLPGSRVTASPPPLPPEKPSPAPEPVPKQDPARRTGVEEAVVETSSVPPAVPVEESVPEDILETGGGGDTPRKVKPERAVKVPRDLQPMTGGQGLAWAGVVALMYVATVGLNRPVGFLLDEMGLRLNVLWGNTIWIACLSLAVWWRFRRHGRAGLKTAAVFLGIGWVMGWIHGGGWRMVEINLYGDLRRWMMMGFVFLQSLLVATALILALGWGLKVWFPRLYLAGIAAGLTSLVIEFFFRAMSLGSQVHWMTAFFFVGAMFGIVSGLSMVRFRKVLV